MADTKISALTASTTPLAGTEVLPIVQSGVTKQVSVANLTAGRAISATELTLSTGNLIIGTSGNGIDFSATPGTGTSELLSDYEEGTYTATITAGSGSYTTVAQALRYTRIGRVINVTGSISITTNGTASGYLGFTLPFNAVSANDVSFAGRENQVSGFVFGGAPISTSTIAITKYDGTYLGGNGYNFPISFSYSI
jgi:hypothetical protein